jgi:hypothetical protein
LKQSQNNQNSFKQKDDCQPLNDHYVNLFKKNLLAHNFRKEKLAFVLRNFYDDKYLDGSILRGSDKLLYNQLSPLFRIQLKPVLITVSATNRQDVYIKCISYESDPLQISHLSSSSSQLPQTPLHNNDINQRLKRPFNNLTNNINNNRNDDLLLLSSTPKRENEPVYYDNSNDDSSTNKRRRFKDENQGQSPLSLNKQKQQQHLYNAEKMIFSTETQQQQQQQQPQTPNKQDNYYRMMKNKLFLNKFDRFRFIEKSKMSNYGEDSQFEVNYNSYYYGAIISIEDVI